MGSQRRRIILLLVTVALLLAACGGDDTGEDANGESGFTDGEAANEGPTARSITEVASIDTFKIRMRAKTSGAAFEQSGQDYLTSFAMEGAFVKDPAAHRFIVQTEGGETNSQIEVVQIDDAVYTRLDDQWTKSQADGAPTAREFLLVAPEKVAGIDELEEVGQEEVSGRNTTHLRGDLEFMKRLDTGPDLNLEAAESGQLEMWLDKEEEFVVKLSLVAEGTGLVTAAPDTAGRLDFNMEYFDFNKKLTIQPPDSMAASSLLGMQIDLPQGSTIDYADAESAEVTLALGNQEARNFLEGALSAHGYALNPEASTPDLGLYEFSSAEGSITVILTEDAGQTTLIMSTN